MLITFASGSSVETNQVGDLKVAFGRVAGVEKAQASGHLVYLLDQDIVAQGRYGGSLIKPTPWQAGDIGFKPMRAEWNCLPSRAHDATLVTIPDHLFVGLPTDTGLNTAGFGFERIQCPAIAHLTRSLRELAREGAPPDRMVADSLATALAATLAREIAPGAVQHLAAGPGLSDARRRLVLDYIEEHLNEQLSLGELANLASLSAFHFSRSFKAAVGMSPLRYVNQRRIERAKHRLSRTDEPIAMVALSCGFSSQSHFTDAFRKATGKTPSLFRGARRLAIVTAVLGLLPRASAYSSAAMVALA